MDSSDDSKSKSFIKHVFNFDEDSKGEMLNIIQYALLAIIPIVILNKLMQKYVPEADEEKGSLEISAEVIIQIIVMFLGLLFINRIITFIPTYSGIQYPEFNIIFIILATLMITMSLQTKLGEKVGILSDRVIELWEGKSDNKKKKKGKKNASGVTVSQPISQGQITQGQAIYTDGTSINSLPTIGSSSAAAMSQPMPDYNNMYRNDSNPLVNAASPQEAFQGGMMMNEPMAANAALGSGAFGSW